MPAYQRYRKQLCDCPEVGLKLDVSRLGMSGQFIHDMEPRIKAAFDAMDQLEAGAIANPDEGRMVGHYWLRAPQRAPQPELTRQIEETIDAVETFAADVHAKKIAPSTAPKFTELLLVGIGGSALGPQLVADALGGLGGKRDKMRIHFLDNTDPDGFDRAIKQIGARLKSTLVVVVSKSGGTKETRNGMLAARRAFEAAGLDFSQHAVAVTGEGSQLDQTAQQQGWLARFPMWDWVGGRTSVMSAVGLLPAALQGVDIRQFLAGAEKMDQRTRQHEITQNPAAMLALAWHHQTAGRGERAMVVLPYKDRLLLFSRYLQQLVMESLGKEKDFDGNVVRQGIAVYGNKGSTDQHAFVQQLREGLHDFFATFIVVMQDRYPRPPKQAFEVDPGVTSGDYLLGFYLGTREALEETGRGTLSIILDKLDASRLGALIALYERAVGFYATLVNINAYHQPGVEAGKKAAAAVLDLQGKAVDYLKQNPKASLTPDELAKAIDAPDRGETLYLLLEHLTANKRGIKRARGKYSAQP